MPCGGRQGVVVEDALSSLTDCSDLVVVAKRGGQQEGEIGKDVAQCLLDGLDGASDGEVGELGEFGYYKVVQCVKEIYPIVGISHVGHEK